ncbi:MAG: DsrE family protein [Firmicutes bacterium]|nr:DsrE family protein [Bacillota bacterium]
MAKIAIVLLSGEDNPGRAMAGLHVAKRIYDARQENEIEEVEVFLFTQGLKLLGQMDSELGQLIRELVEAGVVIGACTNQLNNWSLADAANAAGVKAEFARDAFSRYARDGFTVLTF